MSFDIIEELRESYYKFGPLRKVIRTQYGIAAGNSRKKAVPTWPEIEVKVDSYYDHLKLMAADNIHAPKPKDWWEKLINEAAEELKKQGVPPGEIAKKLSTDFPLSRKTILKYLDSKYKHPGKAKAGKESSQRRQEQDFVRSERTNYGETQLKETKISVSSDEYEKLLKRASELIDTEPEELRGISEEGLRQIINEFEEYGKKVEEKPKIPRTEREIKERIHSPVSRMDVAIPMRLNQMGITDFTTQEPICVYQLIPDLVFPQRRIAVFFDGPGHKPDEFEELMREALSRRGWRVLEIEYDEYNQKEVERVLNEVLGFLGMVGNGRGKD